jgi:hypothetical protein
LEVIDVNRAHPAMCIALFACATATQGSPRLEERLARGTFRGRDVEFAQDEVVLKVRPSVPDRAVREILSRYGVRLKDPIDKLGVGVARLEPDLDPLAVVDSLIRHREVLWAEPNMMLYPQYIPNDLRFYLQWNLHNTGQAPTYGDPDADIDAPEAWDYTAGSYSVLLGILDSGIAMQYGFLSHPDLDNPFRILQGEDYTGDGEGVQDNTGHGTHVAGIAAAEGDNGIGIAGVCWEPCVLVQQVFSGPGGLWSWFYEGLIDAIDIWGCDVINFSGCGDYSYLGEQAIAYADQNDVPVVAASGNLGAEVLYPAAFASTYPNVIAVGAVDPWDQRPGWSNYGSSLCVAAPGGTGYGEETNVYSAAPPDSFAYKGGTSMAAPHVAGLAALMLSVYPDLPDSIVRRRIEDAADDLGDPGWDPYYGHGRINAYRTIHNLSLVDTLPPEIQLIRPNGGERLTVGQTYEILWDGTDDQGIVNQFLHFSPDGGETWEVVAGLGGEERAYDWTVPAHRSDHCLIRLEAWDMVNSSIDESDGEFGIFHGVFRLTHPVEGQGNGRSVQSAAQIRLPEDEPVILGAEPNPFSASTCLTYVLERSGPVHVDVYDVQGRRVRTLEMPQVSAGRHRIRWDARDDLGDHVPQGVYFLRLRTHSNDRLWKVLHVKKERS